MLFTFLRFKVYNARFQRTWTYHSWLFELLDTEIKSQKKKLLLLRNTLNTDICNLRLNVSYLDNKCLISKIESNSEKKLSNVILIHNRKLRNLGIDPENKLDQNKVIFNLSNRVLTQEEKDVLTLGLDFGLVPTKANSINHFVGF